MRVAPVVEISQKQKAELLKLVRSKRTSVRLARRAHIVVLYMSPPEHALVLCCDEKRQVQALESAATHTRRVAEVPAPD